jgi:hypothetical protein
VNKAWLWVPVAVLVAWGVFVVNRSLPKTEDVKPGSPEYDAWFQGMVDACVSDGMRRDQAREDNVAPPLTRREQEALCRGILTRTLRLYPGISPPRRIVPN